MTHRPRALRRAPSLGRSLALIAAQALLIFIFGLGVLGPRLLPDPERAFAPTLGLAALFAVLVPVTVALVLLGSCREPRRTLAEVGWTTSRLGRSFLFGVVGASVCVAVLAGVLIASGASWGEIAAAIGAPTAAERLVFLLIGIHAAFTEETLFRGNLLASLSARMRVVPAVLVTSVVFALYHMKFNPIGLLTKAAFGIVYAALRLRSGSLFAPGVAHALFWAAAGSL